MAHLIDMTNARANMAYVGATPWHGLGQQLSQGASIDQWRTEAGLDWTAKRSAVQFTDNGIVHTGESEILYRSDSFAQLGIVSPAYKIVQPSEVLEFFRDIVATGDMSLDTAGSLDGGRKVWALAKTGDEYRLKGQDEINGYLLLVTSFDGSMATKAMFTSVRVVCNNTLQISVQGSNRGRAVSIPHSSQFDATGAKVDLGILNNGFATFTEQAFELSGRKVNKSEAVKFLLNVLADGAEPDALSTRKANIIQNVFNLYNGKGKGSNLVSAEGTAWGLVNAVTEYVDHEQGNNTNNRFRSGQFGLGAELKNKAFAEALQLVA